MEAIVHHSDSASVYQSLANRLRQTIQNGNYQPGDLLATEHGIARDQSVSRMTVRRASEMLVREGLVERRPGKGLYVLSRTIKAITNASAQASQIQIVAGNFDWEPSIQISRRVQSLARSRALQVQLYDAHGDERLDIQMIRQLPKSGARGAIIISLHSTQLNEALFSLKARRFPFILVDQRLHDIAVPSVMSDNYDGGYRVGQMLLDHGHHRIAFIGDLVAMTVRDRLDGLRDAINDRGIAYDRSLVVDLESGTDRMGDWSDAVNRATADLMGRTDRPTAVFCSCDGVAKLLYRALGAMNLRIPEDISIVGFDDDPIAEWLTPALTTVRQPFAQMGETAFKMLCRQMDDPNTSTENYVLPTELVHRSSVLKQ